VRLIAHLAKHREDAQAGGAPRFFQFASVSSTRWGGAVGVGFEYGFTPNWSFGVEYDHLFMGNANNTFNGLAPLAAALVNNRVSQDVDMVTARINYRFGGYGAPIAARY
jgi:outer membrane immunogenic protein